MKYIGLYILVLFGLAGCKNTTDSSRVYFGGEIINPKAKFVLLMQQDKVIDSLPLQKDNSFGKYFDNLKSGLYYFKHGYEFQYVYFEPKDSLRIRLNMWDFDGTLAFNGVGADRNELLLAVFLENEKEQKNFNTYYALPEKAFLAKVEEAITAHKRLLSLETASTNLPADFLHLIEGGIEYPFYTIKELYAYRHAKINPTDTNFVLSDHYYDYRNQIDFNDSILADYYPYQDFISTHLYNLANEANTSKIFDENFKQILLKLIVDKVALKDLKNQMLSNEITNTFFNTSYDLTPEHLSIFYKNCSDRLSVQKIKYLLADKEKLPKGSVFPDFKIRLDSGEEEMIHNIIKDKNTVIYFWSTQYVSADYLRKRIRFLEKKFPKINFVSLNIDAKNEIDKSALRGVDNLFYLSRLSKGQHLVKSKFPRSILIDARGKVVNSFAVLTNPKIESQIAALLTADTKM